MTIFESERKPLDILGSVDELIQFLEIFPNHKDLIFDKLFTLSVPIDMVEKQTQHLIENMPRYLIENMPDFKDEFLKEFSEVEIFGRYHLIRDEVNFLQLQDKFPEWKAQLFEKFIAEKDSISRLFFAGNERKNLNKKYNSMPCTWFVERLLGSF
ncbi:MAG: hypothetical protein H0U57_12300 [Tatlockia sp.]|nr:hypothetical protein [Tatlockia sp.]